MTLYQQNVISRRLRNVEGYRLRNGGGNRLLNAGWRDTRNSYVEYVGDGVLDEFLIPFYYKRTEDVVVAVWDTATNLWVVQTEGTDYTISQYIITFTTASIPAAPSSPLLHSVEIWRSTPREMSPDYFDSFHHGDAKIVNHNARNMETGGLGMEEIEDQVVGWPEAWTINRWVNNITSAPPRLDALNMSLIPQGVDKPYVFDKVEVTMQHAEAGVLPTDWEMEFWIRYELDDPFVKVAVFPTNFAGLAQLIIKSFAGKWRNPTTGLPTTVDVDPGNVYYFNYTGSIMDKILGRCSFGKRARIPR